MKEDISVDVDESIYELVAVEERISHEVLLLAYSEFSLTSIFYNGSLEIL